MKIVLNVILLAAACLLAWMCYESIQIPVQFRADVAKRDAVVIQRLKDIRTLQELHRDMHQNYCASWQQLIDFAKNEKISICVKKGTLTDKQLADGLNEKNAWKYLCDPKKYAKEIQKFGLDINTFSRDTMKVSILESDTSLMSRNVMQWIDRIQYIPIEEAKNDTFELVLGSVTTASGYNMSLFEAKVPYEVYLRGLNEGELYNKITDRKEQDKYPGLQVGDANQANNNAGNWE
ncbi:MAG: hypothetical protein E7070_08225 [Bacteroidales bacterium]|jgi:hypothetical protein|nr:hypothetical protein [Bacteroidales bacterium]